jgi:transcriptional regulator with PAS, ATPase and Fis domain
MKSEKIERKKKAVLIAESKYMEELKNVYNTIKKDKFFRNWEEPEEKDLDNFIRNARNQIKRDSERNYSLIIFYVKKENIKDIKEILSKLKKGEFTLPAVIFTDEITDSFVKNVYLSGYPHTGGIFNIKKFTDEKFDYEDIAHFLETVKYLLRERYTLEEEEEFKEIGWKIKREEGDAFVSLFIDRKMQRFMREVNFRFYQIAKEFKKEVKNAESIRIEINNWFQELKNAKEVDDYLNEIDKLINDEKKLGILSKKPNTSLPVILIEGDTGTGKTLVAEWLRNLSENLIEGLKFETVSLLNLTREDIERELFGEIGISTHPFPGKFLSNFGGILFLDEIGELTLEEQAKLLLTIETGKVPIKGIHRDIYTRVIIVLATCKNVEKMVVEGKFLEPLYHRILYRFKLPSIKERTPDLRVLVDYLLQDPYVNPENKVKNITTRALIKIEEHDYKGNFRELRHLLTKAVEKSVLRGDNKILAQDIEFGKI